MQFPHTILVDSAEGWPYTFDRIRCDVPNQDRMWTVQTQYASLGRHPHGLGDYSVDGYKGLVAVERKSCEDCISTILGWGGRRDRFEQELENLSKIEAGIVIVECGLDVLLEGGRHTDWGSSRSLQTIAKTINSSILAMMQDYRTPWFFAVNRRHAEIATFRYLKRFVKKKEEENDSR